MVTASPALIPVKSKALDSISEYDPVSLSFRVKYKSGQVYEFAGVSADEYVALRSADSLGRHLNTHFRSRGYKVEA
jgi:hypothetical protein